MTEHAAIPKNFAGQVRSAPGGEHLTLCFSCGTCAGRCLVQSKIESSYNPRRLIRRAVMGLDQAAFEDKTIWLCSACDLCYPSCPQKIHISDIIAAVKTLAIHAGHTSPLTTAEVNVLTCSGCGLCMEICPYGAVALTDILADRGRMIRVARVDRNRCMACGLCAANCRSSSIGIPDRFSSENLTEELRKWIKNPIAWGSPNEEDSL